MPTYEYACASCGNAWEEIQKITAPAVEVCPACHKSTAKRQISGGNFILKGGGWYSDLYASTPKKADTKSDGTAGGGGEAKSDAKTESTPKTSEPSGSSSSGSSGGSGSSGSSSSAKAAE
jgi:putative FmdB family regulatory protein